MELPGFFVIITEENIEECVVDYWKQRVKDFSDVREHELNSDMGKEWLEEIISNISMYTAYDKKSGMSSGTDVTENSRIIIIVCHSLLILRFRYSLILI